jgi:hypothetical protein
MAKMTKSALKRLVKECLVEILAEGLADSPGSLVESVQSARSAKSSSMGLGKRSPLDEVARPRSASLDRKVANRNFDQNVSQAVNHLTDDPVMRSILSDTARTTLQSVGNQDPRLGQNSAPASMTGPNPSAGPTMPGDPAQIFEAISPGSSDKWAQLAFAPTKNRPPS